MQASMEGHWAPLSKENQSIAERWKSQRGSALACECSPASLGSPSSACMCVCVCECAQAVCKCMHICLCVCVRTLLHEHVHVCVQTGLINAAPPSGAMWVEWLVSTSWTLLTLCLPLPGELPTTFASFLHLSSTFSAAPLDIYILLRAQLCINIKGTIKLYYSEGILQRPLMWRGLCPHWMRLFRCCCCGSVVADCHRYVPGTHVHLSLKKRGGISTALYVICTVAFNCTESKRRGTAIC